MHIRAEVITNVTAVTYTCVYLPMSCTLAPIYPAKIRAYTENIQYFLLPAYLGIFIYYF